MKLLFFSLLIFIFWGCENNSETEIYLKSRDDIVKVQDKVVEILTEEPFVSSYSDVHLLNNHLIIKDWKGYDYLIHLLDKHTFKHVKSTGTIGQGPKEIANIGNIFLDRRIVKICIRLNGYHSAPIVKCHLNVFHNIRPPYFFIKL